MDNIPENMKASVISPFGNVRITSSSKTWITNLARMLPAQTGRVTAETIEVYANMLERDVAPEALNYDALHYMVDHFKFWPSYPDLRTELKAYWRECGPGMPEDDELVLRKFIGQEKALIKYFRRQSDRGWAYTNEGVVDAETKGHRRAVILDIIKKDYPRAYEFLTGRSLKVDITPETHWGIESKVKEQIANANNLPGKLRINALGCLKAALKRYNPSLLPILEKEGV